MPEDRDPPGPERRHEVRQEGVQFQRQDQERQDQGERPGRRCQLEWVLATGEASECEGEEHRDRDAEVGEPQGGVERGVGSAGGERAPRPHESRSKSQSLTRRPKTKAPRAVRTTRLGWARYSESRTAQAPTQSSVRTGKRTGGKR